MLCVFNLGKEPREFAVPGMGNCRVLQGVGGDVGGVAGVVGLVVRFG